MKHRYFDRIFSFIIKLLALLSSLTILFVLFFILKESLPVFKDVSLFKFILGNTWRPLSNPPSISILPIILGTIYISLLSIVIALPIGVGCSLFLVFNVPKGLKSLLKAIIDILTGIPSVVYGFIGLLTIVKFFERHFFMSSGESVLAGGILLSIMILPFIISTCEESMQKIKDRYESQARALGVSKWYMISKLILPCAKRSILASVILALGRAMGETMAVMMVIGNSPIMPRLLGKAQTIPSLIALEVGTAQVNSLHYHGLFASGLILMVLLLIINAILYFVKKNITY